MEGTFTSSVGAGSRNSSSTIGSSTIGSSTTGSSATGSSTTGSSTTGGSTTGGSTTGGSLTDGVPSSGVPPQEIVTHFFFGAGVGVGSGMGVGSGAGVGSGTGVSGTSGVGETASSSNPPVKQSRFARPSTPSMLAQPSYCQPDQPSHLPFALGAPSQPQTQSGYASAISRLQSAFARWSVE